MKRLFQLYQWVFSPVLHATSLVGSPNHCGCRFHPSCSRYAETAIERFGIGQGIWLALRRFIRCHPWSVGGIDDVPAR